MKKILMISVLFLFFGLQGVTLRCLAQEMCNLTKLNIDIIEGKVVTNDNDSYPFSEVKIVLYKINDINSIISSTFTDKNGFFKIENIEKGEYRLRVWATTEKKLTLFTYDIIVKIKKVKRKKNSKVMLVRLGGDCNQSEVSRINQNEIVH